MTTSSGSGGPPGGAGTSQQMREQATKVGHEAAQAGGQVAQQAVGQGRQVTAETGRQARNLVGEASAEVRHQAGMQQKRAAEGLRALGAELQSMAGRSEQDGVASEVVRRASGAAQQAAGWLEGHEPDELVNEVRDYARRHPGTFLAGAVVAGLLVGRLTRGIAAGGEDAGREDGHRPEPGTRATGMHPPMEAPRSRPDGGGARPTAWMPGSGVTP